ncbi:substrate-binding protein [bacterium]|nr:substrate-binding protein [bacterium]
MFRLSAFVILCLMFCIPTNYSAESVLFGINVPLSGSYQDQGEDELKAYKLAIKLINEDGGVLGKRIVYTVKDTQTSAKVAAVNAEAMIKEGAIMLTGGSSSAVAIAQGKICEKNKKIFMAALTHSNATTGKDAQRHSFRWYNNGHQTAKAMAAGLIKKYGKDAKYAFLYADYTWGKTVMESMKNVVEKNGATTVLVRPTKLGKKSFVPDLLKVKRAKPDVLVLVHFGRDMIFALKQAHRMKMKNKMGIVVPLMELHMAHGVGAEVMQGVITSFCWYHGLSSQFEGSKRFVTAFEKEYKKKPGNGAAAAWTAIYQYVNAVKRAKSFDHKAVILALEGFRSKILVGEEYYRSWDHQSIHATYVGEGKSPSESKDEWDLFKIISKSEGIDVARTREENPVQLQKLD